jgi:hypothetical protein
LVAKMRRRETEVSLISKKEGEEEEAEDEER